MSNDKLALHEAADRISAALLKCSIRVLPETAMACARAALAAHEAEKPGDGAELVGTAPRANYVKAARVYALAYGRHDDAPDYLPRTQAEADVFEPHTWVIGAMMQAFGEGWADGHAAGLEFMKAAALAEKQAGPVANFRRVEDLVLSYASLCVNHPADMAGKDTAWRVLRDAIRALSAPAATSAPPSESDKAEKQAGPVAGPDGWRIEFGVAEVALHKRGTAQPTHYPEDTVEYALLRDIAAGAQVEAPDLLRMVLDDIDVCIGEHGEHSTEVWESKELSVETVEALGALRRKLKAGASPAPAVAQAAPPSESDKAEKQAGPLAGQANAEVDAWASVPDGELWDESQLDGIFDAVKNNCGPATASRVRAILRAFQTVTPSSERDKEDAADFRWLLTQFRAMSLDMGGNHYWVLAPSGSLRGPTIADAVRAARATNEQP